MHKSTPMNKNVIMPQNIRNRTLNLNSFSYKMLLLPRVAKPFKTHILLMMKRINITKKNFETMETSRECE